jgi:hypothetical protein
MGERVVQRLAILDRGQPMLTVTGGRLGSSMASTARRARSAPSSASQRVVA